MSISGTFYGATGNGWIKPRIVWSARSNVEGNYSDVTATLSYTRTNTGYTTSGHWAGSLTIGSSTKQASGVYMQIVNGGYTTAITHSARVYHNADGSCTVTVRATGAISGTTLTGTTISAGVKLEQIPRAASVSATDAAVGSVSMVSIGRRSDLYTHTLAYEFGQLAGYLTPDGVSDVPVQFTDTTLAFSLPEAFYYEMTDRPSASCSLTCTTYREDAVVGQPQTATFTVQADPARCGPELTAQAEDENPVTLALTGDPGVFVRYASQVRCSVSCQGRFGAAITEKKAAGLPVAEEGLLLEGMEMDSVTFSVRDSRGYSAEQTVQGVLIPYAAPTGQLQAVRTDATSGEADIQAQGSWFSGSFGARSNTLQARCRLNGDDWQTLEVQTDGDTYTLSARLTGLTYTDAHTVTLEISDAIGTLTLSAHVNPSVPVFDWGKEDFCFHIPVTAQKVTGLSEPQAATDAANKAYADAAASMAAGTRMSMKLLWENASPTSTFAAQTIALDLSGYDFVLVQICNWQPRFAIIPIGIGTTVQEIVDIKPDGYTGYFLAEERRCTPKTTGVTFGACYRKYPNSTAVTTVNGWMVPHKIYGIKGLIT